LGYSEEVATKQIHHTFRSESDVALPQLLQMCKETGACSNAFVAKEGSKLDERIDAVGTGARCGATSSVLVAFASRCFATFCTFAVDVFGLRILALCLEEELLDDERTMSWICLPR
jgi:hypothetical protein